MGRALHIAVVLGVLGMAWSAAAQVPGACRTPREAARTFLDNLQPDNDRPDLAIACFERPDGMGNAGLIERARELKAVLDARGLFVVMEDVPDAADYKDENDRLRAPLVASFPAVYFQRIAGEWQFPVSVIHRVPQLYAETFSSWGEALINRLPPIFRSSFAGYELWQPIAVVGLLLLCFLVSRLTRALVQSRLVRLLARLNVEGVGEQLARTARPIGLLAATGLFALFMTDLRLPIGSARIVVIAVKVVAAWAGVLLAYRLADLVVMRLAAKAATTATRTDDQLVVLLRKTLRVLVVAVGIVFVLQNLNVDVTGLLAGLGIGGLALALAAKDTAANLFGSITILIDQPFYVGDWIQAAGVEGTVVEIGLRSTRVRTFYDSEVSVPNSTLAVANIDNYSRRNYRRFKTNLSIGYESTPEQVQAFVEGVRALIARHPDTRKDYYEVHFTGYGDSWLEVLLYTFFQVGTWSQELQARQHLLLEIKRLADDVGVSFAFPTQTLHIETQAEATDRSIPAAPSAAELAARVRGYGPGGDRGKPQGRTLTHGFFAGDTSARGNAEG
ncbi:MAG: mechanosensitive ion channel family protein [Myxococcales bacterium]|nr:mechanosensitive ion channel family protein [Myxococcales bacterium]